MTLSGNKNHEWKVGIHFQNGFCWKVFFSSTEGYMEMKFKRWASNCSQFSSSQYEHCLRRGHTVEKMGLRNMFGELSVISHIKFQE